MDSRFSTEAKTSKRREKSENMENTGQRQEESTVY